MASFEFHRPGWLDKMVEYHKNKLFEEFRKVPAMEIVATIQPTPKGYVDSSDWDFDSVSRLLYLVRVSESALAVRTELRRMFANTRRKMTFQESVKAFPSLGKVLPNDIYYDIYSSELYGDVVTEAGFVEDNDTGIIMVSNPVEARLPSAMISISLLRKILEERSKAARYMPTTRRTIPWKPMTKTTSPVAQNTTKQEVVTTTGTAESHTVPGSTGGTGVPGTSAAGGGSATTTVAISYIRPEYIV